ncbi:hypothetical protein DFJ74DRAFT_670706 [Hyaloraphidium curvatum]|nr:hypothetical protein DFJ74DRAFT_670706 [Hyaloraphidium curvatum]
MAAMEKSRQKALGVELPNETTVLSVPRKGASPGQQISQAERDRTLAYAKLFARPAYFAAEALSTIATASSSVRRWLAMDHDLLNALGSLAFSHEKVIPVAWEPKLLDTMPARDFPAFIELFSTLIDLVCSAVSSFRGPSAPRLRHAGPVSEAPFAYFDRVSDVLMYIAETRGDIPEDSFERATHTADTIAQLRELNMKDYVGDAPEDSKERMFTRLAMKKFDEVLASTGVIADTCDGCGREVDPPKRCGRCRTAFHCSAECQRREWPEHKDRCVAVSKAEKVWAEPGAGDR